MDRRAARELDARRPGDRVRAGRQRQLRRVRPAGADRRRLRAGRRVAARRRRVRAVGGREPGAPAPRRAASSAPTRGPPTPTSGSTSPTTAAWRSSPTAPRTGARWASPPPTWSTSDHRDNYEYTPEASRRARGFAIYAALRSARPPRARRPGRPLLRPRRALRRAAARRRRRDPQRRRAQPGAGRVRAGRDRARAGRRHVLGRRHRLARPPGDADLVSGWATTTADVERSATGDPQRAVTSSATSMLPRVAFEYGQRSCALGHERLGLVLREPRHARPRA